MDVTWTQKSGVCKTRKVYLHFIFQPWLKTNRASGNSLMPYNNVHGQKLEGASRTITRKCRTISKRLTLGRCIKCLVCKRETTNESLRARGKRYF